MRVPKHYVKKDYLGCGIKVNENEVLSYCEALRYMWNIIKKSFSIMSDLQTHSHYTLDLKKMDRHAGSKWLISYKSVTKPGTPL